MASRTLKETPKRLVDRTLNPTDLKRLSRAKSPETSNVVQQGMFGKFLQPRTTALSLSRPKCLQQGRGYVVAQLQWEALLSRDGATTDSSNLHGRSLKKLRVRPEKTKQALRREL